MVRLPPPVPLLRSLLTPLKNRSREQYQSKNFFLQMRLQEANQTSRGVRQETYSLLVIIAIKIFTLLTCFFQNRRCLLMEGTQGGKRSRCNICMRYWQPGEMERTEQPVERSLDKMTGIDGEH